MSLFIETELGKLQNLYLLQDVRVAKSIKEENKFAVGYVQANGMIIEDELFDSEEDAQSKVNEIREKLLK